MTKPNSPVCQSRSNPIPSFPVQAEAEQNRYDYRALSVGDLWDEAPDDAFLVKHHAPLIFLRGKKGYGMQVMVNQTMVFEVKALRSLRPYLLDTDNYS